MQLRAFVLPICAQIQHSVFFAMFWKRHRTFGRKNICVCLIKDTSFQLLVGFDFEAKFSVDNVGKGARDRTSLIKVFIELPNKNTLVTWAALESHCRNACKGVGVDEWIWWKKKDWGWFLHHCLLWRFDLTERLDLSRRLIFSRAWLWYDFHFSFVHGRHYSCDSHGWELFKTPHS